MDHYKHGQKKHDEVHTADEQFKKNGNMSVLGGVAPVMTQHGHGDASAGNNKEGHAKGHSTHTKM